MGPVLRVAFVLFIGANAHGQPAQCPRNHPQDSSCAASGGAAFASEDVITLIQASGRVASKAGVAAEVGGHTPPGSQQLMQQDPPDGQLSASTNFSASTNSTQALELPFKKPNRMEMVGVLCAIFGCLVLIQLCAQTLKSLPCCRCIPFAALAAFALFLIGEGLSSFAFSEVGADLEKSDVEDPDEIVVYWRGSFGIVLAVNTLALAVSFLGAGCLREYLFGARSEAHPALVRCGQCLLGPLLVALLELLVWLTLIMKLLLSYGFLVVGIAVVAASSICDVGSDMLVMVQKLLDEKATDMSLDINKFCAGSDHVGMGGVYLFMGCAVTVISQAAMLMALAGEKARVESEMEKKAGLDTEE